MQRTLAAKLASQAGLDVVSFQHFDCLLFERGETWKMFLPYSKRMLGGTAQDRMVIGNLLAVFDKDIERLRPPSERFKFSRCVTSLPIANFPSITTSSMVVEGVVDQEFFLKIEALLNALPNRKSEWITIFGEDFCNRAAIDRFVDVVRYLQTQE
ncbi:MAG: hypothetical protein J0I80_01150 [Sphingomonas sp.]|nr:hypothetical protein [Sphingomonas sp.]